MSEEIPDDAIAEAVQKGYARLPNGNLLMGMPLSDFDGCPIEAVLPDGHHPCELRRGHDGDHEFADEGGYADEQPPPVSDLECKVCEQAGSPHGTAPVIVYVSIGNSDDKLTQAEWSQYCVEMIARVVSIGNVHGQWYSPPASPYQNACWCIEFRTDSEIKEAREVATEIREKYRQDSIAWAVVTGTEFL